MARSRFSILILPRCVVPHPSCVFCGLGGEARAFALSQAFSHRQLAPAQERGPLRFDLHRAPHAGRVVAGGPVKVFNSDSPSMRCAPSKLRLLRLGWGSTSVCPLSSVLPQATGSRAGTRSTAIRSPPCPSRRTRSAGSSTTASLLASQPVRAPPDCDEYTESLRSASSLRERCCRTSSLSLRNYPLVSVRRFARLHISIARILVNVDSHRKLR